MRKPLLLMALLLFENVHGQTSMDKAVDKALDPIRNGLSLWARLLERMSQERPPSDDELHFPAPKSADLPPVAFTLPPLFQQSKHSSSSTIRPPNQDVLGEWARSSASERSMSNVLTPVIDGIGPLILPLFGLPAAYQQGGGLTMPNALFPFMGGHHQPQQPHPAIAPPPASVQPQPRPIQRQLPPTDQRAPVVEQSHRPLPIVSAPPAPRQRAHAAPITVLSPTTIPYPVPIEIVSPVLPTKHKKKRHRNHRKRGQSRSRSHSPTLIRLNKKTQQQQYWPSVRLAGSKTQKSVVPSAVQLKSSDEYLGYPKFPHRRFLPNPSEYRAPATNGQLTPAHRPSSPSSGPVQPLQVEYGQTADTQPPPLIPPYQPQTYQQQRPPSPLDAIAQSRNLFERILGINRSPEPNDGESGAPPAPSPTFAPSSPAPLPVAASDGSDSGYDLGRNQVQSAFDGDSGLQLGVTSRPPIPMDMGNGGGGQSISDGFGIAPASPPSDSSDSGLRLGTKPDPIDPDSGLSLGKTIPTPDDSGLALPPPGTFGGGSGGFGGGRRPDSSYDEVVKASGKRKR